MDKKRRIEKHQNSKWSEGQHGRIANRPNSKSENSKTSNGSAKWLAKIEDFNPGGGTKNGRSAGVRLCQPYGLKTSIFLSRPSFRNVHNPLFCGVLMCWKHHRISPETLRQQDGSMPEDHGFSPDSLRIHYGFSTDSVPKTRIQPKSFYFGPGNGQIQPWPLSLFIILKAVSYTHLTLPTTPYV